VQNRLVRLARLSPLLLLLAAPAAAEEPDRPALALPLDAVDRAALRAACSTGRLPRRAMMDRFAAHPLAIHVGHREASLADTGLPPGGPQFVLAVDDDGSIHDTDWTNPDATTSALQAFSDMYYAAAPDNVQFIVTFTSWGISTLGAFYFPMANDTTGIGYQHEMHDEIFDWTPGSPLEGYLMMNGVDAFGGGAYATAVFDQELAHRWAAFVRYDPGDGTASDALLGRDLQHWSYFFNTDNSPMEGNRWTPGSDGMSFISADSLATTPRYSQLDLYLMGLVAPTDVMPSFLILTATPSVPDGWGGSVTRASPPEYDRQVDIAGTRSDITIDQVIKTEGPRMPAFPAAPTELHIGFLYVVKAGQQWRLPPLMRMEARVEAAVAGFEAATGGRAHVVVESHGAYPTPSPLGAPCPSGIQQCDTQADGCVLPPPLPAPDGGAAHAVDGGAPAAICVVGCASDANCAGGCCRAVAGGSA
jgi:hypothetical protein